MAARKYRFSLNLLLIAAVTSVTVLSSAPVIAQNDAAGAPAAIGTGHSSTKRRPAAQASSPASVVASTAHHRRHHAVTPAPPGRHGRHSQQITTAQSATATVHGKHHRSSETTAAPEPEKNEATLVIKDKHGRRHEVVAEVTVDRRGRKHTHYRDVAQETVVRDRHGHIIRRFFQDVAHSHHRPLQSEESTVNPKKDQEAVVQKEPEELPHEYGSYGKVYALYDEATNARLSGNYSSAIASLSKALDLVPPNAHGGPSVLTLNMEFELAQAAEASGNYGLSARYFARTVADRPNFTEAFVHLANVLARNGHAAEALRAAKSAVEHNPNDPRAHTILSVMLARNGFTTDAKAEKARAQNLLGDNTRIDPVPAEAPNSGETGQPMENNSDNDGPSGATSSQSLNQSTGRANNPAASPSTIPSQPSTASPSDASTPNSAPEPGALPTN